MIWFYRLTSLYTSLMCAFIASARYFLCTQPGVQWEACVPDNASIAALHPSKSTIQAFSLHCYLLIALPLACDQDSSISTHPPPVSYAISPPVSHEISPPVSHVISPHVAALAPTPASKVTCFVSLSLSLFRLFKSASPSALGISFTILAYFLHRRETPQYSPKSSVLESLRMSLYIDLFFTLREKATASLCKALKKEKARFHSKFSLNIFRQLNFISSDIIVKMNIEDIAEEFRKNQNKKNRRITKNIHY